MTDDFTKHLSDCVEALYALLASAHQLPCLVYRNSPSRFNFLDDFRSRKVCVEAETDDELDWPPDFDKMIARGERQERKRLKKEGTLQQQRSHELRILCKEKAKPIRFQLSMEEQRKTANFSSALRNFKRLSKLIKTEWEQS